MKKIKLSWYPYTLELKHPFNISTNSRTTTPAVMVEIEYEGLTSYGEASLPPYLPETQESVQNFLSKIDLSKYNEISDLETVITDIDKTTSGNNAAKASIDIALHDLAGKIKGLPVYEIYGIKREEVYTSFTIGIDSTVMIRKKLNEAEVFRYIKVKLGSNDDKKIIENIRSVTQKPVYADINQGWINKEDALDLCHWLNDRNVVLIEQPFQKNNLEDTAWLNERSPIPIIADEAIQRLSGIEKLQGVYSGVNIKLMKSAGLLEAIKMIYRSRELNLKIMLGCMTETSCAISAAAQICSMADWVDLDGNILIKNDKFEGTKGNTGKIMPSESPGLGIRKIF
jgi:L-alanine-DL-glutamate epimerase-like enolase superfamily enzyme